MCYFTTYASVYTSHTPTQLTNKLHDHNSTRTCAGGQLDNWALRAVVALWEYYCCCGVFVLLYSFIYNWVAPYLYLTVIVYLDMLRSGVELVLYAGGLRQTVRVLSVEPCTTTTTHTILVSETDVRCRYRTVCVLCVWFRDAFTTEEYYAYGWWIPFWFSLVLCVCVLDGGHIWLNIPFLIKILVAPMYMSYLSVFVCVFDKLLSYVIVRTTMYCHVCVPAW